jgi:hypothetical protein
MSVNGSITLTSLSSSAQVVASGTWLNGIIDNGSWWNFSNGNVFFTGATAGNDEEFCVKFSVGGSDGPTGPTGPIGPTGPAYEYRQTFFIDPNGSNSSSDPNFIGPGSAYDPVIGDLTKPWRTLGSAINWYSTNGMTGAHSGNPIFFLWPGQYAAEFATIEIPSNSEITVQMSKGSHVTWAVNAGLFHLNSQSIFKISGASHGDPYKSTTEEELQGVNGPLIKFDATTEDSFVSLEGIRARVATNWPILDLQPGITGSGVCEVIVNESAIWTDNAASGSMSTIIVGTGNKTDLSIDNSIIQQSKGSDSYAVINQQSGKLYLSNSIVNNRWDALGTGPAPAINVTIPSGDASSNYLIYLNNTVFYAGIPKSKDVIKDTGSNTGSLNVFINSNCSTNMNLPSTTHTGVLIRKGPGILELTDLPFPLW